MFISRLSYTSSHRVKNPGSAPANRTLTKTKKLTNKENNLERYTSIDVIYQFGRQVIINHEIQQLIISLLLSSRATLSVL